MLEPFPCICSVSSEFLVSRKMNWLQWIVLTFLLFSCGDVACSQNDTIFLSVNTASSGRPIPPTLFGIFFEEINHAGAGGLWAELVSNRGFEAGGPNIPSDIDPWSPIGNETFLSVTTEESSCFEHNKIALRLDVICNSEGENPCPDGGLGIYNPGYWGMNIEEGESYNIVFWMRLSGSVNLLVAFTSSDGTILASSLVTADGSEFQSWKKVELTLTADSTDHSARLSLTTSNKSTIWLDQVSAMPVDTFKGHGCRKELANMLVELKPRFIRFPGGCFVEGVYLRNAFRWKATVGPWEERPGHFGDVWEYWTDDGLGYYEFLQLAEDLDALPVWVFNNGIGHKEGVSTSIITPFVQEALDGIEFARGPSDSTWGSKRTEMGHPEPFNLKYVAIGNEDCGKQYYQGNYLKFYQAIKAAYPDIQIISNCDGSSKPLDHPADMYDFHIYTTASNLFSMSHKFDRKGSNGPKAFVSEYAVTGNDAGHGSFLAALAEAGFLIGLERNRYEAGLGSDIVEMASYAPLFVNSNNRRWNPDAIVLNSWQQYGTPSYWVQTFFKESSGASLLPIKVNTTSTFVASAIKWTSSETGDNYITLKAVNFGSSPVTLVISLDGLPEGTISLLNSKLTIFQSDNLMSENSFAEPQKVAPRVSSLKNVGPSMSIIVTSRSVIMLDLLLDPVLHSAY